MIPKGRMFVLNLFGAYVNRSNDKILKVIINGYIKTDFVYVSLCSIVLFE